MFEKGYFFILYMCSRECHFSSWFHRAGTVELNLARLVPVHTAFSTPGDDTALKLTFWLIIEMTTAPDTISHARLVGALSNKCLPYEPLLLLLLD